MSRKLLSCIVLCCVVFPTLSVNQEVLQWTFISYNFEAGATQEHVTNFKPENVVLTGVELFGDKIFLATPRLREGVPATLSTVSTKSPIGSSPVLEAFPNWAWHDAGRGINNCSGLISVYRLRTDRCGRLWVLDAGVTNSLDDFQRVCPPKIIIFDMKTFNPLRAITFPEDLLRTNTLFTNLVIDDTESSPTGKCDDVFVYITDTAAPALIVYDGNTDSAWRVTHASMYPDPDFSQYRIGNDMFSLMDGVVGLSFSSLLKTVYFQPLATDRTFSISADALKQGPPPEGVELPVRLVGRKSSQGLGLAVDPRSDTLFYSPLTETAVASWNPHTNKHELLDFDPEKLQFVADIKWFSRDPDHIWVLSSRFQKFFLRNVNANDINIRVMRIPTKLSPWLPSRVYRQVNSTHHH